MKKKLYHTNYAVATDWCNNALVLCNNIPEIDPSVWDNFKPLVNLEADDEEEDEVCPKCGGSLSQIGANMVCDECGYGDGQEEIFQWYITDCSEDDVNYLIESFGLIFTYSDLLDCWILCVTQYGTNWYYCDWYTTNPNAERQCGEKK